MTSRSCSKLTFSPADRQEPLCVNLRHELTFIFVNISLLLFCASFFLNCKFNRPKLNPSVHCTRHCMSVALICSYDMLFEFDIPSMLIFPFFHPSCDNTMMSIHIFNLVTTMMTLTLLVHSRT